MSLAHHSLVAWQRADDLFFSLHRLSLKQFPSIERVELGGQLRRAAFSVAVNIVEGFASPAGRARVNFSNISKSSLAEVGYIVHVAHRLGYFSESVKLELEAQIRHVGAPLAGLIRAERLKVVTTIVAGAAMIAFLSARVL